MTHNGIDICEEAVVRVTGASFNLLPLISGLGLKGSTEPAVSQIQCCMPSKANV